MKNENFNKEIESIKKYKTQITELSNCTKKFNKGDQQQNKSSKRKDQQTQRQGRLLPEKQKDKRMKKSDDIKGLKEPYQSGQYMYYMCPRRRKERQSQRAYSKK